MRVASAGLVAAVMAAGCGSVATHSVSPATGLADPVGAVVAAKSGCPDHPVEPARGAPRSFGLDKQGVPTPMWSARAGSVEAVEGLSTFTVLDGCVLALSQVSGQEEWGWAPARGAQLMGVTAGSGIVVVATGVVKGTAPAMIYAVVDGLVGLDARTGRELWRRPLAHDGQAIPMPASVAGGDVVVSEANGAVVGLSAATGSERWSDPPPVACVPPSDSGAQTGLSPVASVLPGGPAVTVSYQCRASSSEVVGYDPATGAKTWAWRAPAGWSVQYQSPVGSAPGVIGLVASGPGSISARRVVWPFGPAGYESYDVVAVDEVSGRPLWEMEGVPASSGVYGGAGELCAASGFGVECLNPESGALIWRWQPVDAPANGGQAGPSPGVVASSERLYLVAPTEAARRIDSQSTTQQSPPGTFDLRVTNMATGQVVEDQPLPAYYGGSQGVVVSVDAPPGVMAVGTAVVLVSPQVQESDVVEAFKP